MGYKKKQGGLPVAISSCSFFEFIINYDIKYRMGDELNEE